MKLLFLLPLVLISYGSFSQNCEDYYEKVDSLYRHGNTLEAIKIAHSGISCFKDQNLIQSEKYGDLLNILGFLNSQIDMIFEAESLYVQSILIYEKTIGNKNIKYARLLNNLAGIYVDLGDKKRAEEFYLKTIRIREEILGVNNLQVGNPIYNLALLYFNTGDYNKAETYFLKSFEIFKKSPFGENSQYYNTLSYLIDLYNKSKLFGKEEILLTENLMICKKYKGEDSEDYAVGEYNLGVVYLAVDNFSKAENLLVHALNVLNNKLGNESQKSAIINEKLARLYLKTGRYVDARQLFHKAISINKKLNIKDTVIYANLINDLAVCNQELGEYNNAKNLYIEALSIYKFKYGEESTQYATTLCNLGEIERVLNNISNSEHLFKRCLEIRKNILGVSHIDNAGILNNLGLLYHDIGNYEKAKDYFIQAQNVYILNSKEDEDYAGILINLGNEYKSLGNYKMAEITLIKSSEVIKNYIGELNPTYAGVLNGLGGLYFYQGKTREAELVFKKTLSIYQKTLGEKNPSYAIVLKNIAGVYESMNQFTKAEELYNHALEINQQMYGRKHPEYTSILIDLSRLYDKIGNFEKADSLQCEIIPNLQKNLQLYFSFLSTSELNLLISKSLTQIGVSLSFLSRKPNSKLIDQLSDFNLFIKNAMLQNNMLLGRIAQNNHDTSVTNMWNKYKELRLLLSKSLQMPLKQQNNLEYLKSNSDSLEKILITKLPEFQQRIINDNIRNKYIQNILNPSDASIDFVNFQYFNKHWTDTMLYAAFITRHDWKEPQFIKLFNEDQLAELFDSSNNSLSINNLYCTKDSSCNSKLYNLIWKPMDSLLTGVKRVYISPSGLLNRVSFSAIPTPGGGRLIDRYSVEVLSNIRTIAETKPNVSENPQSMSLIGGVNYDEEPTVSYSQQFDFVTSDTSFSNLRSLHGGKWSYLSGSEKEVIGLSNVITPLKISLSLKTGSNASEEFIKEMGSGRIPVSTVMHIATHGFSFASPKSEIRPEKLILPNEGKQIFRSSIDALTRAGLVMAGGNEFWTTGKSYPNHEDGILTAREVSELNLNGCILATLSACETGLGEIMGSEGVFGLQRAFKMAGVKYLIVSLWKVPDAQTTEFMQLFYSSWLIQKLPIRDAFRQTQLTMSKKYSPYQWAAFVLVQ